MKLTVRLETGEVFEWEAEIDGPAVVLRHGRTEHRILLDGAAGPVTSAFIDGRRVEFGWLRREGGWSVLLDGTEHRAEVRDARAELAAKFQQAAATETGETSVKAPIPGLVRQVHVKEGDVVKKDQTLLTLDAMKLENEIPCPRDGRVRSVGVKPGLAVEKGQVLVVVG